MVCIRWTLHVSSDLIDSHFKQMPTNPFLTWWVWKGKRNDIKSIMDPNTIKYPEDGIFALIIIIHHISSTLLSTPIFAIKIGVLIMKSGLFVSIIENECIRIKIEQFNVKIDFLQIGLIRHSQKNFGTLQEKLWNFEEVCRKITMSIKKTLELANNNSIKFIRIHFPACSYALSHRVFKLLDYIHWNSVHMLWFQSHPYSFSWVQSPTTHRKAMLCFCLHRNPLKQSQ